MVFLMDTGPYYHIYIYVNNGTRWYFYETMVTMEWGPNLVTVPIVTGTKRNIH